MLAVDPTQDKRKQYLYITKILSIPYLNLAVLKPGTRAVGTEYPKALEGGKAIGGLHSIY